MAATKIDWCNKVWNPVTGCTPVSPGCERCYAKRMATCLAGRCGYPADDPFRVTIHQDRTSLPLHWRKPCRVFVNSMGDLFHDDVPDGAIMDVWRIMGSTLHTYLILTKRARSMKEWLAKWCDTTETDDVIKLARGPEAVRNAHQCGRARLFADMIETWGDPPAGAAYPSYDWQDGMKWWPRELLNVWLGVTAEDQERADERIPLMLQTPAVQHFISVEPMLGPVNLRPWLKTAATGHLASPWIICGPETGPGARPCQIDWIHDLLNQCRDAGVPFFYKGRYLPLPRETP